MVDRTVSDDIAFYHVALRIDRDNLAWEHENHAHQHGKIAREAVLQASRLSAIDLQLKRYVAQEARDVRARLQAEAKGRVTDAAVMAQVESGAEFVRGQEQRAAAKQLLGEWEALREASRDRGYQLGKLTDLAIAGLVVPGEPRMTAPAARAVAYRNGKAADDHEYEEARSAIAAGRRSRVAPANSKTTIVREEL